MLLVRINGSINYDSLKVGITFSLKSSMDFKVENAGLVLLRFLISLRDSALEPDLEIY